MRSAGTDTIYATREHINYLELAAFTFTIRSFIKAFGWKDVHILHKIDNIVALSYINRLGGRIWKMEQPITAFDKFCCDRGITVRA